MDVGIQHPLASVVGYVGAGGVGVLLHIYQEYYQWDRFAAVLVFILGLVPCLISQENGSGNRWPPAFRAVRWQPKHFPQFPGSESGPFTPVEVLLPDPSRSCRARLTKTMRERR